MSELGFCLTISAMVYIFLHTPIGDMIREPFDDLIINLKLKRKTRFFGEKLGYLLSCAFCLGFWFSLLAALFDKSYLKYSLEAAIISLALNKYLVKQIFDKQS